MKDRTLHWLYNVPGRKKRYILVLMVVQALHGASGVLYSLLLRDIVDAAAGHDITGFLHGMFMIILLVAAQLALRAVIRWLTELGKSAIENIFNAGNISFHTCCAVRSNSTELVASDGTVLVWTQFCLQ